MYTVIEVKDKRQEKEFLRLPVRLYKGNPNWIRPLDNDLRKVFDPQKNPSFKHGECTRWLLIDDRGACVGRVAAFINGKTCRLEEHAVGQMGFFECIDDREAAFRLFDTCREWLEARGMEVMEGPVNFGERMEWWGLLVDGFDRPPNYAMPYTHPYYVQFFEAYGFRDYFKQFTYRNKLVVESLSPVVIWKADRLLKNPDYSVFTYREIGAGKAVDSLLEIYNKAWNLEVHGVECITRDQVEALYKSLKSVIDEDLIYFVYFREAPIGFFLMFPEMNQVIRRLNGRVNFVGMLKFLYYKRRVDVALGQLFGVVPEFQGKGVEAALIKKFCETVVQRGSRYKYLEMNWVGDFNPQMMHLMDYLSASVVKTHITCRKLFREDIKFVRSVDKV